MSTPVLELIEEQDGDELWLCSPDVGLFTNAQLPGELLAAGALAGQLMILGRAHELRVPASVQGRIQGASPALTHQPVAYGTRLYHLSPLGDGALDTPSHTPQDQTLGTDALVLKSPQTGRFYHRPSPMDEPFINPGQRLVAGQEIGMIEVMKTFTTVSFPGGSEWPEKVHLKEWLAEDGAEVTQGEPLGVLEEG